MSEKRNIRDHKRRLFAAKYELRRFFSKAFFFIKIPIFLVRCGTNIVISCPSCQAKKKFLCTSKKPMYFHGSPSWSR